VRCQDRDLRLWSSSICRGHLFGGIHHQHVGVPSFLFLEFAFELLADGVNQAASEIGVIAGKV